MPQARHPVAFSAKMKLLTAVSLLALAELSVAQTEGRVSPRATAAVAGSLKAASAAAETVPTQTVKLVAVPSQSAPVLGVAADAPGTSFEALLAARSADARSQDVRLSPVREAALRDTAQVIGIQWGLGDRSRELDLILRQRSADLDKRYNFGRLSLGAGFLPPVIHEVRDLRAIDNQVLRVGKVMYQIAEPPRPFIVAPSWRDWLYQGLDADLRPGVPSHKQLLPHDDAEQRFWQQELRRAYQEGRTQAQEVFDLNLVRLKATHEGMERYYDLYKRGIMSAPVMATAGTIVDRQDPNTIVIGNMVLRITVPADFVEDPNRWVPLAQ